MSALIQGPSMEDLRPYNEEEEDAHGKPEPLSNTEMVEARFVHPEAKKLFALCPWMRHIPVYSECIQGYGWKTTWALGLCYFLCKGISDYTLRGAVYAMLVKRFKLNTARYQRLSTISNMGWALKAFTAMLCDAFAFMGYTKRWYMFISCVAGAVFSLIYGLLPARPSSADTAAAFIFLASYGKANVDILSEGHYSRLMRRNPKPGPSLVSWIWWYIMIGALISSVINGPLADAGIPQVSVFIATATQFLTAFFFIFNWYEERTNRVERAEDAQLLHENILAERARLLEERGQKKTADQSEEAPHKNLHPELYDSDDEAHQHALTQDPAALQDELQLGDDTEQDKQMVDYYEPPEPVPCLFGLFEFNKEVVTRNWKVFVYSIIMTCAVVAMTCGNILADTKGLLIICVIVSVLCCGASFWALPPVIAKANVFAYLVMTVYLQIPGATQPFYIATPDCLPDGPHFNFTFYNTVGDVIGYVAGIFGVSAFKYIFTQRSYRLTFMITTTIKIIASVFDIVIVKRWNVAIGIPDHAMYICGDAVVFQVIYMIDFMPITVLLSRLCPRGSESVVYALMAGFSNLGQTMSSSIGAVLMEYAWPVISDAPCDFSNVPWLLLVGHMLAPMLVYPLTLLLPSARICDDIDVDGKVVKKEAKREVNAVQKEKRENHPSDSGEVTP